MQKINYDIDNLINWSSSQKEILKQFNAKKNTGLLTCYNGHYILFQEIKKRGWFSSSRKRKRTKIRFEIDDANNIIIPSHNLIISKYLIEPRYDYFLEIPLEIFRKFFPKCNNFEFINSRKELSWEEICEFEKRFYSDMQNKLVEFEKLNDQSLIPLQNEINVKKLNEENRIILPYKKKIIPNVNKSNLQKSTIDLFNDQNKFCKTLISNLPKNAKILDLGSSQEPWFSYHCAINDLEVFAFDIIKKENYEFEKEVGVTFINDDINNLKKYSDILNNLDLIFCRDMSPPQKLGNWYDPNFITIWETMKKMIKNEGIIYWEQMGNGSGIEDFSFTNHSMKYFKDFFEKLGVFFKITKYGYSCFKITKNKESFSHPWNSFEIINSSDDSNEIKNGKNLYESKDYGSLLKNYALQMNEFFELNDYELKGKIEISGNKITQKIIEELITQLFRHKDYKFIYDDNPSIKIKNGSKYNLSNIGYEQKDYFLIDQNRDRLFTESMLNACKRDL